MKRLDRRTFLRGAGGITLGLPFLDAMLGTGRTASAQAMTAPKRIIFFQTPNGMQMDGWRCTLNGSGNDPTDFTFSEILQPLESYKSQLLIIEGIEMSSSYDPAQQATAHQGGAASLWTGYWAGPGQMDGGGNLLSGYSISHSLDHELAQHPQITGDSKFPAYYFGVLPTVHHVISRLFYAGADQPIGPNANPYDVNRQIFSDLRAGEEELTRLTAERRTVLDAVLGDYRSLRCKLGSEDRAKLDLHLAHVESIESQLGRGGGAQIGGNCQALDLGAEINWRDRALYPALGRLQMDQMVAALACDLTRVAAFQWHSPVGAIIHSWQGHTETHHEITHRQESDAIAQQQLKEINTWYAQELKYLLDQMSAVTEANGKTLLENSVVVWTSEISTGWNHNRRDMPFVLAGGLQDHFRTGRYLKMTSAPAHSRLHLSLAQAMGANLTTFGAPGYDSDGPLTDLT